MPMTATVTYDLGKCIHYNMIAYQLWYDQLITQLYKAFQLYVLSNKTLRGVGILLISTPAFLMPICLYTTCDIAPTLNCY